MKQQRRAKLNQLEKLLPAGSYASTSWLVEQGYPTDRLSRYAAANRLESPARGVYRRPGPPAKWQHAVASLNRFAESPPHVGGLSALELLGMSHFVPLGKGRTVHLYGDEAPPSWLFKLPLAEKFEFHRDSLFDSVYRARFVHALLGRGRGGRADMQSNDALRAGLNSVPWGEWDWQILVSSPERALLEVLDDVPRKVSFEHADNLLARLPDLSSRRLLGLLKDCRSVKVKRLFLALAERHRHPWVSRVLEAAANKGQIDLGKGKRSLARGGYLHPKYLVTLPAEWNVRRHEPVSP